MNSRSYQEIDRAQDQQAAPLTTRHDGPARTRAGWLCRRWRGSAQFARCDRPFRRAAYEFPFEVMARSSVRIS
jgi:hypothetical protein